jgi:hypothetical protein
MPGMNAPMGILTVPIWVAGAASAVFLVAIVLAIGKAGAAALIASLFRVAIVALGVYAGWVYLQRAALQDQAAERRSLDERSAALMAASANGRPWIWKPIGRPLLSNPQGTLTDGSPM